MVNEEIDCSCSRALGSDLRIHSRSLRTPCSFGAKHTETERESGLNVAEAYLRSLSFCKMWDSF